MSFALEETQAGSNGHVLYDLLKSVGGQVAKGVGHTALSCRCVRAGWAKTAALS